MPNTTQSPSHSGEEEWSLHRSAVASADASPPAADKKQGVNMKGYEEAIIEVITLGDGDPTVTVWFWSEAADAWVEENPSLSFSAVGVGENWQGVVKCRHRRMFVALGGTLTDGVDVRVAGHRNVVEGS